ncbi:MAG TPA: hypothetical protein PL117_14355 [Accumulibacter sp.]|uniref:hypothetical protein n=1 Tax=Accumulibacter sp. TaxID=2053492 RepID=UPI002C13F742|nr:hypothetical protein [Accumulibacter sp.]HRF73947.1 hypothetical protein [Accumulibacter sp.]
MNRETLHYLLDTPVGQLAEQSSEILFRVKNDADELLAVTKTVVEHLDRALDLKYAHRAHQLRLAADLPKKVEWDQKQLVAIARRIAATGDDPSEYLDLTYRVSETRFTAWPKSLKTAFAPARTVKTGKAGFRLALLKEKAPW